MLRSGFLLGVSGPAAILALLLLPTVRQGADAWTVPAIVSPAAAADLPGARPASLALSPIHPAPIQYAVAPRSEPRAVPAAPAPATAQQGPLGTKRMTREGCEAPLSSLVGPEARRMVPGRCMA